MIHMKKMLKVIIMMVCIVLCGVIMSEYVEADEVVGISFGWGATGFAIEKEGPFYGSKDDLLAHVPEKYGKVNEVYVRVIATASLYNNWRDLGQSDPKITKIVGKDVDGKNKVISVEKYSKNCTEKDYAVEMIFGPIGKNSSTEDKEVEVYMTLKQNSETCYFNPKHVMDLADSFDGGDDCRGKLGNAPKCEITFKLGSGTEGDSGKEVTVGRGEVLYRYDQEIEVELMASDNGPNDGGIIKAEISSGSDSWDFSYSEGEGQVGKTVTLSGNYDEIEGKIFSIRARDVAGKTSSLSARLSDYVKKALVVELASDFKTYVKDDRVVVKINVKSGGDLIRGISGSKSTNSESGYMDINSAKMDGSDLGSDSGSLILYTKNKPTDPQKIYLCYKKDNGIDYKEIEYRLEGGLQDGYESNETREGSDDKLQKFDISKGSLLIDRDNVAHYGEVLGENESTVNCKDEIIITGTTDKYTVKIDKEGKTVVLDNVNITSSEEAIDISGSTNLKIKSGSTVTLTSTSGNAMRVSDGTLMIYGGGTLSATTNSSSKAAIAGNDINIYSLSNLETQSSDGAGVGCDMGGSCGNIKIINCGLNINTTGGGAGIGSGKDGSVDSVVVEGIGPSQKIVSSSGACIGSGSGGSVNGEIVVEKIDAKLEADLGSAIGTGNGGRCNSIRVHYSALKNLKSDNTVIGASGSGGQCDDISVSRSDITISSCKVGIGSTGSRCGNITLKDALEIEIESSEVGVGVTTGIMGDININTVEVELKIKATEVGIGSTASTGGSAITIQDNYGIEINDASVGIGSGSSGEIGDITVQGTGEKIKKMLIKAKDVCIGGKGKVGSVKISGSEVQLGDSSNECQIGIGKLDDNGSMGEVEIKGSSDIKIYASKIGIGNENSGSSSIKITGSNVDISGVSDIGIGTNGQCGGITIDSSSKVRINSGAKVGIGAVGTCGNISISGSYVQVGSNDSKCTVGIGTTGGSSGNISISSGGMSIYAEVGIGAGSGKVGSISLNGSKVKMSSVEVGIGANEGEIGNIELNGVSLDITSVSDGVGIGGRGRVGTITISNGSKVQVSSGKVGIGAGGGTVGDISLNASKVNMSSVAVGIGANGGSVGNVEIGNNAIVIKTSYDGIGVGGKDGAVGGIKLEGSNIEVSDAGIGIGSSGAMGDIEITGCGIVRLGASDVGIGTIASNSGKKINISNSGVYVGNASVCIGSRAEMGDIIIGSSRVKVNPNSGGIGIGSTSYVECINIEKSDIEVGSTASVGIGVSDAVTMGDIYIKEGKVKIWFTDGIGIGSIGINSGKTIMLDRCDVNVSGTGVGIGAIGAISAINIKACGNVDVVATTTCIGCSYGGTCGDINIEDAGVYAEILSGEGCGIGGLGTIGNININNSKVQTKTGNGCGIGNSSSTQEDKYITIEESELDITVTGSGTGIGCGSGGIGGINIKECAIKIKGGSGHGAGIGCGSGKVGGIELENNAISIHKEAGSDGAGIGSGQGGDAGNMNLNKNKIVVASGDGAGIGSGSGGKVTGSIIIDDGVIIARGVNGCAIGSGSGGSVGYIHIKDGKIYAKTTGSGSGIGGNVSSSTLEIDTGDILCNATGDGSGMSAIGSTIVIHDGKIYIRSNSGNALGDASGITIEKGDIEAVSNGACGISGGEITINSGVVKAKGGNWDINGSSTIKISMNANVQAYNNKTTDVQRKEDGSTVTQKKLHTDFWRDNPGTAKINGGDYNVRTDSSGDVYFWTKENETGLTFDLHEKLMVI